RRDENVLKPKIEKEWTIMTFINGKNNLEHAGLFNVNQMEVIGSDKNMNIVVEIGRMSGQAGDVDLDGDWTGSRRLYIKKDKDREKMTSPVIMETKNVDMGDYKRIVDFVKWTKANYPAKKYMLVIWNHGSGWFDPPKEKKIADKGISHDDETGNYVRTIEIGKILEEAGKVDILAFDACLMQMAEVAYEVKDYSDMIIASENTDHGFAFLYKEKLSSLTNNPTASLEETAMVFINAHKKFYSAEAVFNPIYGVSVPNSVMGHTVSVIKSAALNDLPAQLNAWTEAVKTANESDAILHAVKNVLRFGPIIDKKIKYINTYADLGHFVKLISEKSKNENVKKASAKLLGYITGNLVYAQNGTHKTEFYNFEDSTGIAIKMAMMLPVSIYEIMPEWDDQFLTKYPDFNLSKDSNWDEFLNWLQKTYIAAVDSETKP
ncbi:MAG: hypothetical protein KAI33_03240, partial [Elusimicrobiales bacterium]|nr:hypothetical protein [Elusimicrobiales bacterium]